MKVECECGNDGYEIEWDIEIEKTSDPFESGMYMNPKKIICSECKKEWSQLEFKTYAANRQLRSTNEVL